MSDVCGQVLSLSLTKMSVGVHAGCGQPLNHHYGQDCFGTVWAPPPEGESCE